MDAPLPRRKCCPAFDRGSAVSAVVAETRSAGCVAGSGDFCASPGHGRIGRVDHRAEKHAFAGFFLGGLLAYGRFNSFWKTDNNPSRRWGAYVVALILLLAALLAKTTTFSFPAVILLICWWKQRKHPLAGGCPAHPALFCPGHRDEPGGTLPGWRKPMSAPRAGGLRDIPFPDDTDFAGRAFWFYLGNLLCPVNLCFIYPRWRPDAGSLWQWLYPVMAVATLGWLWLAQKKIGRGPATAAFFLSGPFFPCLDS